MKVIYGSQNPDEENGLMNEPVNNTQPSTRRTKQALVLGATAVAVAAGTGLAITGYGHGIPQFVPTMSLSADAGDDLPPPSDPIFFKLDTDGNGYLTTEEVESLRTAIDHPAVRCVASALYEKYGDELEDPQQDSLVDNEVYESVHLYLWKTRGMKKGARKNGKDGCRPCTLEELEGYPVQQNPSRDDITELHEAILDANPGVESNAQAILEVASSELMVEAITNVVEDIPEAKAEELLESMDSLADAMAEHGLDESTISVVLPNLLDAAIEEPESLATVSETLAELVTIGEEDTEAVVLGVALQVAKEPAVAEQVIENLESVAVVLENAPQDEVEDIANMFAETIASEELESVVEQFDGGDVSLHQLAEELEEIEQLEELEEIEEIEAELVSDTIEEIAEEADLSDEAENHLDVVAGEISTEAAAEELNEILSELVGDEADAVLEDLAGLSPHGEEKMDEIVSAVNDIIEAGETDDGVKFMDSLDAIDESGYLQLVEPILEMISDSENNGEVVEIVEAVENLVEAAEEADEDVPVEVVLDFLEEDIRAEVLVEKFEEVTEAVERDVSPETALESAIEDAQEDIYITTDKSFPDWRGETMDHVVVISVQNGGS